jgi:predicted lipoprotein
MKPRALSTHPYNRLATGPVLLVLLILLAGFSSCNDKKDPDDQSGSFDKKSFLLSLADRLIVPSVIRLDQAAEELEKAANAVRNNPDAERLDSLRAAWKAAYMANLWCNSFNYGPGEQTIAGTYFENTGLWPVNASRIEARIQSGQVDFSADFERDTRGFLALDYLLYENGSVQELLAGNDKRLSYLSALSAHLRYWTQQLRNGWNGPYRQAFVDNDGKDAGSSVSMFYNEYLKAYEGIKNFKLGLPSGKRVGQSGPEPALAEAYYSGISVECLKEHLKVIEYIWYGRAQDGTEGTGFDDWLKTVSGGDALIGETENFFNQIREKAAALPAGERLSDMVVSQPGSVEDLYNTCLSGTRFIKSDLSSLIGIAITYSSGDGD